jgi:hypothetical protein
LKDCNNALGHQLTVVTDKLEKSKEKQKQGEHTIPTLNEQITLLKAQLEAEPARRTDSNAVVAT